MLYYLILLVAMVILPKLEWLLFVAMIQGGFLDWTLLFFLYVGRNQIPPDELNWQPICKCFKTSRGRFSCWYGFAALFHLLTVEVLFVGFALNNPVLIGAGSILLVPTFLSYTYWAFGEDRLSLFCGPSLVLDYKKTESADFTLEPFEHTSRTTDILWQKIYWDNPIKIWIPRMYLVMTLVMRAPNWSRLVKLSFKTARVSSLALITTLISVAVAPALSAVTLVATGFLCTGFGRWLSLL